MRMKSHYDLDELDPYVEELKAERQHQRRQQANLLAHPDCRDPDHLGCDKCEEDESED
jgi:hypothetical protein